MATFRIPTNPPYFTNNNFNPAFNTTANSSTASVQEFQAYFLSYPQAQGKETLLDTTITGDLILTSSSSFNTSTNLILDSSSNYIQFGDGTKQHTAPSADDPNTVYNDISNTFISPNIQTFQGSNATVANTGPLQFSNIDNNEFGAFSVNPNNQDDLTLYSNQPNGGFTIRNIDGNSFTMNPTANNTCTIINPITSTYGITATQLTLNDVGNTSILTTTVTGLNVDDAIVSTGTITGNNLVVAPDNNDSYSIYSNTNPSNYGLVIANTTGGDGTLTLSNNSTTLTTLTSSTAGLTISDPLVVSGGISCNGYTITSGAINTGAISGSGLTTTGNITTASNGLGGTSVFNDTVCNFNSISCGGNVDCDSLSSTGAITASELTTAGTANVNQLTLTNGLNSSILTTSSSGLNINDDVISSTGNLSMGGSAKLASVANQNGNSILATNQGLYITRNMTNQLAEYDIVAINTTTSTGLNIYCSQGDVGPLTSPEISITDTKTTINADLFVNPSNTLYINTIVPANTGPIQIASGTTLASTPVSSSNDTTIATTQFVNTAISLIPPSGILTGTTNIFGPSGDLLTNANNPQYGYIQNSGTTLCFSNYVGLPSVYTNYSIQLTMNNLIYTLSGGGLQMLYGTWYSIKGSGNGFQVAFGCSVHVNNPANVSGLPQTSFNWTAIPR